MTDETNNFALTRRSFLFTLAAVTCLRFPQKAEAFQTFKPFTFGYVTDAHLVTKKPDSYKLLQQSQLFLQDAVKSLNNLKPDFVIFGGDQVETPGKDDNNWQLFLDVAQVLNCPWSFVLGEQDVSGPTSVDKMKTFGPDWKAKGIETEKPYWSQTPMPGVHLIGLDTSRPNSTTGDIGSDQLDWLKNDLTANSGKFTIVFSHHPLLPPPPFDTGPPWDDYIAAQGDSAREALNRSGDVRLAVSGHLHVSKIQKERDIWYVSSPSLDVYPCEYRFFRVTPESIVVETYQVAFPALVKKARLALDASNLAFKYNEHKPQLFADLCAGTRADQSVTLALVAQKPSQPAPRKDKKEEKRQEKAAKESEKRDKKDDKDNKKDKKESSKKESSKKEKKKGNSGKNGKSTQGGSDSVDADAKPDDVNKLKSDGSTNSKPDADTNSKPDADTNLNTGSGANPTPNDNAKPTDVKSDTKVTSPTKAPAEVPANKSD